jgi:hypothetical protein
MAREVWITPRKKQLQPSDFADAAIYDCSEVANGIPSILEHIITEDMLPCLYEEQESSRELRQRNLEDEIDVINEKILDLHLEIDGMKPKSLVRRRIM